MQTPSLNSFSPFSYYEANTESHYVSAFPSVNTTPYLGKTTGFKLFDRSAFTEDDLKTYLKFLKSMNFGFKDNIGWLMSNFDNSRTNYSASELCEHMNFLEIISTNVDQYATMATVASTVLPTPFVLRLHEQSSPQKAIDTVPCYVNGEYVVTTIGYKKKSPEVSVTFSDGEVVSLLNIGIFGYVNGAGEHVNARTEGPKINECIAEYRDTINKPDKIALYKDVEIANRGLIEEVGLNVENNAHAKFFIFGISNKPRRDGRYAKHRYVSESGQIYEFSYDRSSESVLVGSIIKAIPPKYLPDPSDLDEMEAGKSRLIKLDDLIEEFKIGGKFEPAFPEHVNQLALLKSKLHLMI